MSEKTREICVFCRRPMATDEDWDHPAMENDEPHAELDALCWDPGDPSSYCMAVAAAANLPTDYEEAAEALWKVEQDRDRLRAALTQLQMGPDTLTQDGLAIVLRALYPTQPPSTQPDQIREEGR